MLLGLNPSSMVALSLLWRQFKKLKNINEKRGRQHINMERRHINHALIHKDTVDNNQTRRTQSPKIPIAKANELSIGMEVCNYVMTRIHTKQNHILPAVPRGPMKATSSKSSCVHCRIDHGIQAAYNSYASGDTIPRSTPKIASFSEIEEAVSSL